MRLLSVAALLCLAIAVESHFFDHLLGGGGRRQDGVTTTTEAPKRKPDGGWWPFGFGHHGHGHGKRSSSSSSEEEQKRTSPRLSPRTPDSRRSSPSSPRTPPSPPAASPTTLAFGVSQPACGQSIFPITRPLAADSNFTYNPDILFEVTQNETGCDFLTISCSGYLSAFISGQWGNGDEVIFPEPVTATDSYTKVTATYTLPWEQYGWGAKTLDKVIKDNAFFCFVGSLVPPQKLAGPSCSCKYDSVWVDLMILIDASGSSGDAGLQQMFGYVQTALNWFNIQNSSYVDPYHTRIGIISYASKATLLAPLGSITGEELENWGELEYFDEEDSNISAAIELAQAEFQGPARRKNVKKVIALFGTSFNYQLDPALEVSRYFKEDDGTIFVYNYVESMGIPTDALAWLASPGYFYTEQTDKDGKALMKSLCDINCYCPDEWASYKNSNNTGIPTAGCYYPAPAQANFRLATSRCELFRNGSILAVGKTSDKSKFLWSLLNFSTVNFWAGIKWIDVEGAYFWLDGTPVQFDLYQPWDGGHEQGMDCVAVINQKWVPVDCRTGFYYVCEAAPCDSTHYCLEEE